MIYRSFLVEVGKAPARPHGARASLPLTSHNGHGDSEPITRPVRATPLKEQYKPDFASLSATLPATLASSNEHHPDTRNDIRPNRRVRLAFGHAPGPCYNDLRSRTVSNPRSLQIDQVPSRRIARPPSAIPLSDLGS